MAFFTPGTFGYWHSHGPGFVRRNAPRSTHFKRYSSSQICVREVSESSKSIVRQDDTKYCLRGWSGQAHTNIDEPSITPYPQSLTVVYGEERPRFTTRKAVSENDLGMKASNCEIEAGLADMPEIQPLPLPILGAGGLRSPESPDRNTINYSRKPSLTIEHYSYVDVSTQTGLAAEESHLNSQESSLILNDTAQKAERDFEMTSPSDHPTFDIALAQKGDVYIVTSKDWDKMQTLRPYIWGLRSKVRELRNELKVKQAEKASADDKLIKFLRKCQIRNPILQPLGENDQFTMNKLYEDSEQIRSTLGPLELECNSLENELSSQEFILHGLESKVNVAPQIRGSQLEIENAAKSLSTSSEFSTMEPIYHPLVTAYLSKMGDVDILRERLDWHLDEKADLEEEKAKRERVGLTLSPPDQAWLDQYESAQLEIIEELNREQELAERLRVRCYSMGLIDDEGEPTDFQTREEQTFQADLNDVKEASGYVKFPTLIPPPNGIQIQLQQSESEDDINITSRTRVNHWLLHQLRMSALDVNLFAETFKIVTGNNLEAGNWQNHVLSQWYEDEAGDWPSAPRTSSSQGSSDAVSPPHQQAIYPEVFPTGSSRKSSTGSDGFESTIRDLSPSRSRSSPASLRYRYRHS